MFADLAFDFSSIFKAMDESSMDMTPSSNDNNKGEDMISSSNQRNKRDSLVNVLSKSQLGNALLEQSSLVSQLNGTKDGDQETNVSLNMSPTTTTTSTGGGGGGSLSPNLLASTAAAIAAAAAGSNLPINQLAQVRIRINKLIFFPHIHLALVKEISEGPVKNGFPLLGQ